MGRRKTGRANGYGTLEIHGRTFRGKYFKVDPDAKDGFARVTESTGIRVDGTDAEDRDIMGNPDPKHARMRAEQWLEERTAVYRHAVEEGMLRSDASALAGTLKVALSRVNGEIEGVVKDKEAADDKLPAYSMDKAWDAFAGCLESRQRDPATQKNYDQWFHLFSRWMTENHPEVTELRGVNTVLAREYAAVLLERVRGTTYNRHLNALSLIWATLAAHDADGRPSYPDAKLKGNPFAYDKATKCGIPRVKLEKSERPHRRRDLSLEELAKLMTTATGEMRVLIALGFYTGLRLGDCATLKVSNFDRTLGIITTRSRKTDTETQTAIHPCLAQVLQEEVKAKSGYILPDTAELYTQEKVAKALKEDATLTDEQRKKRLEARQATGRAELSKRIERLFRECGIETSYRESEDARARPEAGFHSLRHSYATQLERAKVAIEDRRKLMGHASAQMTEHYTHGETGKSLALPNLLNPESENASAVETELEDLMRRVEALGIDDMKLLYDFIGKKINTQIAAVTE